MEIIEVNGKKYRKKQIDNRSSKSLNKLMMIQGMLGTSINSLTISEKRQKIDLVEEYGLIQQKKSRLSSNDRGWVEYQFERYYEPIH